MEDKVYIAIDLKSFYASVECAERGLDPLGVHLVVADKSRSKNTICLAVSPSLKSHGVSGRARLFEVIQQVKRVNDERLKKAPYHRFHDSSYVEAELQRDPGLKLDYVVAKPQMAHYIDVSSKIYGIYLRYIAPEDIHVYSIDEVFIDATPYLKTYNMDGEGIARMLIQDVLNETGITATAGIGTNLYLAKVAMDIIAKHSPADENGVRMAYLDEMKYRELLWDHEPLTDFWRIGHGYETRLTANGIMTMGDIARTSLNDQELLYKLFGINEELLIDHAWGYEPCTMGAIKSYVPENRSISQGQVLMRPYTFEEARLITREMTEQLTLDLVDKKLMTDAVTITIGYDSSNISQDTSSDYYGRAVPRHAHGTVSFKTMTSSSKEIMTGVTSLFDKIVNQKYTVRRIGVTAINVTTEQEASKITYVEQGNLFGDLEQAMDINQEIKEARAEEKNLQQAVLKIKKKYGKNAVVRGMDLEDSATTMQRNDQIGGHKA